MSEGSDELKGYRGEGVRFGQLLALLGVTGFAISQPLLSIAGENPAIFIYAGVRGSGIVVFALLVALAPPLSIWVVIVAFGMVNRRAGDLVFAGVASGLVAVTVIQWAKSAGVEREWLLGLLGLVAAVGFGYLLTNIDAVAAWARLTSPLPVLAVVLLLLSPTGQLVKSPAAGTAADLTGTAAPSVVVIMLDELPLESLLAPDGSINDVRFPNLAGFAENSTWYQNYTVMANITVRSVPSILTGTNPNSEPPIWTSHPNSLFTLLAPTHELMVTEVVTQMCGFATCPIDDSQNEVNRRGLKNVLSQMADVWRQRVALGPVDPVDLGQFRNDLDLVPPKDVENIVRPGTVQEQKVARPGPVNDIIGAIRPGDVPTLHYLHVMLPHQPWLFYPDGQPYSGLALGDDVVMPDAGDPHPWIMAELQQGHLFQAQYADKLVGEVIDQLQATGRYDDSLVVVTADHGVGFSSYPNTREFNENSISDLASVPLFVKEPDQDAGRIDESNLMSVDLLPTLADELGLDIDWDVDGYPAGSPEIHDRGDTKVFYDFMVLSEEFLGTKTYEASRHQPKASNRLVGPIYEGDNPIAGLIARLGAEGYLDQPVADLAIDGTISGTARVNDLVQLQQPPEVVVGRVLGSVDDVTAGRIVLVAFNGTVVSAAPVRHDGAFETMLPPGIQEPDGNEVTLYLVADDGTIGELDLS